MNVAFQKKFWIWRTESNAPLSYIWHHHGQMQLMMSKILFFLRVVNVTWKKQVVKQESRDQAQNTCNSCPFILLCKALLIGEISAHWKLIQSIVVIKTNPARTLLLKEMEKATYSLPSCRVLFYCLDSVEFQRQNCNIYLQSEVQFRPWNDACHYRCQLFTAWQKHFSHAVMQVNSLLIEKYKTWID